MATKKEPRTELQQLASKARKSVQKTTGNITRYLMMTEGMDAASNFAEAWGRFDDVMKKLAGEER